MNDNTALPSTPPSLLPFVLAAMGNITDPRLHTLVTARVYGATWGGKKGR